MTVRNRASKRRKPNPVVSANILYISPDRREEQRKLFQHNDMVAFIQPLNESQRALMLRTIDLLEKHVKYKPNTQCEVIKFQSKQKQ